MTEERLRPQVVLARPFRHAFVAQSLVELADQVFLIALVWAVLGSGDSLQLGLVLTAWAVPRGIFLLLGGVVIDRADSRLLALGAGAALAALNAVLIVLIELDAMPLAAWVALAIVLGAIDGVRLPIGYSLIPLVVPKADILAANRWSQLRLWAMLTLGPPIGGLLIAGLGVQGAFVVVAALYLGSGAFMMRLPSLRVEREATQLRRDLRDGLRFVSGNPVLRLILPVFAVANLFVLGLVAVAIPSLVKLVLDGGASALGLVSGAFGLGLVAGTISMSRFPAWTRQSLSGLFCLFALSDVALACVGLAGSVPAAAVAFAVSGFFIGPASTLYQATLQTITPPELLGRVTGLARSISFGLEPASGAIVGVAANAFSAGAVLVAGGLAATLADLVAVVRGRGRERAAAPAARVVDDQPERREADAVGAARS